MTYETVILERKGAVGIVTLNRPQALNALSAALIRDLGAALDALEEDAAIGAIVVTGSDKAFAAGADIKEMASRTYMDVYLNDFITRGWERITTCRKPIVAAVAGYALGGGCEIAMMCDTIIAADTAKFGQPEITIGTIPGSGGTQRLTRVVGKAKAMEMCLTGRMMDAAEAERSGLVSRVVPAAELLDEALKVAGKIASLSRPIVLMAKEAVNRAYETTLASPPRTRRRAWPPSSRSASRSTRTGEGCRRAELPSFAIATQAKPGADRQAEKLGRLEQRLVESVDGLATMVLGDRQMQGVGCPQAASVVRKICLGEIEIVRVRQQNDEGLAHHGLELRVGAPRCLAIEAAHANLARQQRGELDACQMADGQFARRQTCDEAFDLAARRFLQDKRREEAGVEIVQSKPLVARLAQQSRARLAPSRHLGPEFAQRPQRQFRRRGRGEAGHRAAVPCDDHVLAGFDLVQQLAQMRLRLGQTDRHHCGFSPMTIKLVI